MGKRVTLHNQKGRRGRGFSAAHNDRTNTVKAEHIDEEKSGDNLYWTHDGNRDFIESELRFYDKMFRQALEDKNNRYIKNRHPERCQTMIDYYRNEKSAPDETLLYVGKKEDTIDREKLWKLAIAYRDWIKKEYPQYMPLSIALHADEAGAPHLHFRGVFIGHDKDGNAVVGMESALKEMGVERPDLKKKEGRHNNRKMTFTAVCREKFQHLAKAADIEIEVEPQEPSKSGFSLAAYQAKKEQEKAAAAAAQREAEEKRLKKIENRIESAIKIANVLEDEQMRLDGIKSRVKKKGKTGGFETGNEVVQLSPKDYGDLIRMASATAAAEEQARKEKEGRWVAEKRSVDADARLAAAEKRAKKEIMESQKAVEEINRQWFDYADEMAIWEYAPPDIKKRVQVQTNDRTKISDTVNRFAARLGAVVSTKTAVKILAPALMHIGVAPEEHGDYIKACVHASKIKKKPHGGRAVGGWHNEPTQTDYNTPTKIPKWIVDEVTPLINIPLKDDGSHYDTPWEWLTEVEKDDIKNKQAYRDDY